MRHRLVIVATVAIVLFTIAGHLRTLRAAQNQNTPTPTFRSSAEAVQVTTLVTDASGNMVSGLSAEDFEILENDVPQPITTFSAVNIPIERTEKIGAESDVLDNTRPPGRMYLIALDEVDQANALKIKNYLKNFIEEYFGPNDVAAVVLVGRGLKTSGQEFTSNRHLLLAAIDSYTGGFPGGGDPMRARNVMGSLRDLTEFMVKVPGPRKAMIFVSEGIPGDALDLVDYRGGVLSIAGEDFQAAVSAATRGNVAIYPIDPAGLTTEMGGQNSSSSLRSLAQVTGGFALTGSNNFKDAFERIVRENSTYYILGFNSTYEKRNAKYVRISVRVRRPGLIARSLDGYVAPRGTEKAKAEKPSTLLTAVREAVASPVTTSGVPLRMFAAPFKGEGPNSNIEVTLEVAAPQLGLVEKDGAYRGDLEIVFAITDATKKRRPLVRHRASLTLKPETYERAKDGGLRVVAQLALPKGRYQIRASAGAATLAGSIVYDLQVPDFGDDLAMSGITVTSNRARRAVTFSPHERLNVALPGPPITAREFSADDELTLFAQVYENRHKPHTINFKTELRKASGIVVGTLTATRTMKEPGRQTAVYDFSPSLSLADLEPGKYIVHMEAQSSLSPKDKVSREVPFTVRGAPAATN